MAVYLYESAAVWSRDQRLFEKQFRMAQASMREMLSRERDEAEKELNKEKKKYLEKENGRKKKD